MAHQNRERPFLNATAGSDTAHFIIQKACFYFLAATTAVMVYGSFRHVVEGLLPDWLYAGGLAITVFALYLIIDHRLDGDFFDHWRARTQVRSGSVHTADPRAARAHLAWRGTMLWLRFALTLTSSIWAGAEIAEISTAPPDYEGYAQQMTGHEERSAEREALAVADLQKAESMEADRVARATDAGDQLVAAAVASGNVHQQSMYRTNPGFFYPPPQGKYYKTNKAYGERISQAKAERKALIDEAKGYVATARASLAQVRGTVSTDSTTAMIGQLAAKQAGDHEVTVARRTTFVRGLDIVAAFMGLLILRIRYLRQKAAGWAPPADRRNLSSLLAQWRDRSWQRVLAELEVSLNLDIDGDGHIGDPPSRAHSSPTEEPPADYGYRAPTYRQYPPRQSFPITPDPALPYQPSTAPAAPPPPPPQRVSVQGFRRKSSEKPVATPSYAVATDFADQGEVSATVEATTLLEAWKSMQSNVMAARSRPESDAARSYIDNLQSQMEEIENRLRGMGWTIDKKSGKTGKYYLSPR